MKFNEYETQQFVKIYVEHENLWNPRTLNYKVREERIKSYRQIIAQFKSDTGISLTIGDLTNKIKALRCTYILELEKITKRAHTGSTYKTKIKWFGDMHKCLKDVAKTKKMDPTIIDSLMFEDLNPDKQIMASTTLSRKYRDMESDSSDGQKVWITDNEGENESDNLLTRNSDYTVINTGTGARVKRENSDCSFRSTSTEQSDGTFRDSVIDSFIDTGTKEDEFDIYGKYIASQLRTLNLQKALRLQLQIQGLVSDARIAELTENKY